MDLMVDFVSIFFDIQCCHHVEKNLSSKLKRLVETKDVKTGNREELLKYLMTLSLIE